VLANLLRVFPHVLIAGSPRVQGKSSGHKTSHRHVDSQRATPDQGRTHPRRPEASRARQYNGLPTLAFTEGRRQPEDGRETARLGRCARWIVATDCLDEPVGVRASRLHAMYDRGELQTERRTRSGTARNRPTKRLTLSSSSSTSQRLLMVASARTSRRASAASRQMRGPRRDPTS